MSRPPFPFKEGGSKNTCNPHLFQYPFYGLDDDHPLWVDGDKKSSVTIQTSWHQFLDGCYRFFVAIHVWWLVMKNLPLPPKSWKGYWNWCRTRASFYSLIKPPPPPPPPTIVHHKIAQTNQCQLKTLTIFLRSFPLSNIEQIFSDTIFFFTFLLIKTINCGKDQSYYDLRDRYILICDCVCTHKFSFYWGNT